MKTLKNILLLVLPLAVLSTGYLFGQDMQKLDNEPSPIGGIEAIMAKVKYPEKAKEQKLEGKVFVNALIDEKGNVEKVTVTKSADKLLDDAAVKAIKQVKFTPGEKGGKKVKSEVTIPVKFKLH